MSKLIIAITILVTVQSLSVNAQTLEEKVAQMLIIGFRGTSVQAYNPIYHDITRRNIGGVVLYENDNTTRNERNINSKEQLKTLTSSLQALSKRPLIIAIDQEGGRIQRLKAGQGFGTYPSHLELGKKNDAELTKKTAAEIGYELKEYGINWNFAPVTDVMINRSSMIISRMYRSFSDDPDDVYVMAKSYIQGLQSAGIISTIKHFPGFGSETGAKHNGIIDITKSWSETELEPYKKLFADKSVNVDAVMVSHVYNANLDPDYPASLSKAVITDLLRDELGFNGVILGESPQAIFIIDTYGLEQAIKQQVLAGVDMLQFANNLIYDENVAAKTIYIITEMVRTGEISEERIDASYQRILKLKKRINKNN